MIVLVGMVVEGGVGLVLFSGVLCIVAAGSDSGVGVCDGSVGVFAGGRGGGVTGRVVSACALCVREAAGSVE